MMGRSSNGGFDYSLTSCSEKECVEWVHEYFNDCVCGTRSWVSFGLGLLSLVCWGVAEIPQIVTNFKTKSGHGVSLALLLTWIVGDFFNLVGCVLEPATLPTQLYTAALYTIATVILVMQTVYYDYWLTRRKNRKFHKDKVDDYQEEEKKPLNPKPEQDKSKPIPRTTSADVYYTSARSLANSGSSPYNSSLSYLRTARSGPSVAVVLQDNDLESSSEDDQNASPSHRDRSAANKSKRTTPSPVSYGTFLAASAGLPVPSRAVMEAHMGLSSRKLLMANTKPNSMESGPYGLLLGWIMAAIYMGGRLPQIYLNIKRGSVEGLNPLMFIFALIANGTYVGSILVRSTDRKMIQSNAPWLLDALVCVLLDILIMLQYAYYKYMKKNDEVYEEAKKPLA